MKKRLRAELLKKRDFIPPEQKVLKEAEIKKSLFALDAFKKANSLLLYVSFRSEADTTGYLDDVIKLGKKLILPVVDSRHRELKLYEIRDTSELVPGYMGIYEPGVGEDRRADLKDIDLVIIPGVGFDIKGNRLGYGGGCYDRLLSFESGRLAKADHHIMTIALAFEEQISEEIPTESHDIKVDIIITDKRLIHC